MRCIMFEELQRGTREIYESFSHEGYSKGTEDKRLKLQGIKR